MSRIEALIDLRNRNAYARQQVAATLQAFLATGQATCCLAGIDLRFAETLLNRVDNHLAAILRDLPAEPEPIPESIPEEPPPAPVIVPNELPSISRLREMASSRFAKEHGEPVRLITKPRSGLEQHRNLPYFTAVSQADAWEKDAKNSELITPETV